MAVAPAGHRPRQDRVPSGSTTSRTRASRVPSRRARRPSRQVPERARGSRRRGEAAANSSKVDYEAEVAFVIAERCSSVPEEGGSTTSRATCWLNDLSARDLQFSTPQWIARKGLRRSGALRAGARHPDEDGAAGRDRDRPHGERRGAPAREHADLSTGSRSSSPTVRLMTLEPGDIVSTGTPAGVGSCAIRGCGFSRGRVVITRQQLGDS